MLFKNFKLILFLLILYQSPLYSKSITLNYFNKSNLSKYFSGIIAFENKDNSKALSFYDSSKILLNKHDPFLKDMYIHLS